jgi:hypothetical protein
MKSMTFDDFYNSLEDDCNDFVLYVVRTFSEVIYVGISNRGIWNRWFGYRGRMWKDANNKWCGKDLVGQEIAEHVPDSLQYIIQLYTLDDLYEAIKDDCPIRYHDRDYLENSWVLNSIEAMMIEKLKPALNVMSNRHQRSLHPAEDEAKQMRACLAAFGQLNA